VALLLFIYELLHAKKFSYLMNSIRAYDVTQTVCGCGCGGGLVNGSLGERVVEEGRKTINLKVSIDFQIKDILQWW
jgi:hypothetical protein